MRFLRESRIKTYAIGFCLLGFLVQSVSGALSNDIKTRPGSIVFSGYYSQSNGPVFYTVYSFKKDKVYPLGKNQIWDKPETILRFKEDTNQFSFLVKLKADSGSFVSKAGTYSLSEKSNIFTYEISENIFSAHDIRSNIFYFIPAMTTNSFIMKYDIAAQKANILFRDYYMIFNVVDSPFDKRIYWEAYTYNHKKNLFYMDKDHNSDKANVLVEDIFLTYYDQRYQKIFYNDMATKKIALYDIISRKASLTELDMCRPAPSYCMVSSNLLFVQVLTDNWNNQYQLSHSYEIKCIVYDIFTHERHDIKKLNMKFRGRSIPAQYVPYDVTDYLDE